MRALQLVQVSGQLNSVPPGASDLEASWCSPYMFILKVLTVEVDAAESFPDYNIRNYVMRQAAAFKKNPDMPDEGKIQALLDMWGRQSLLYQHYKRPHMGIIVCCHTSEHFRPRHGVATLIL